MLRTAIYMRVSTDRQAREGDSISAQRDALRKYIDNHQNMIFAGEYLDDGISGTKDDRTELQRMLSDVQAGKINLILVTKMDRLHRSLRNFLNMQDTLDKHNCNWLAIWEPMYDSSTPQGRMVINLMMNLAQFEAEQTGQRIRQVLAYKVSQGEAVSGSQPVGFSIVDKRLVPNQDAQLVRDIFDYYNRCGNLERTIRAFQHYTQLPRTNVAFRYMLKNTKYIGSFRGNDNYCEPIIDKALFGDVQRKLAINIKMSQTHTYIFSGLLRCAVCGASMAGCAFKKRRAHDVIVLKRYRCTRHYVNAVCLCENGHHMYENTLEKFLIAHVREKLEMIVYNAEIEEKPIKDNAAKIAALEKKISRLKDLYVNDLISIDEYKTDKEALLSELSVLASQSAPETKDMSSLYKLLNSPFEALYATFSDEQKRYFWRSIIKEIRFTDSKHLSLDDIIFL